MSDGIPKREDRRRELSLWVLVAADACALSGNESMRLFEDAFVGSPPPASPNEASEYFRIERFEDYLPNEDGWDAHRVGVEEIVSSLTENAGEVDALIKSASPRWRLERMPIIDRALLRMGVAELVFSATPRPRATINGMIELAKRYGSPTTPAFVNGILDQIRRDRDIPFA